MLRHLDLFSGIGGFALAAQMVGGIETRQFVEINSYCQRVLEKNFPGVAIHGDITTYTAKFGDFDLVTGGFPCQDISCANPNGRGLEGERSGLFFELMRIVRECRPRYLVLENVAALLSSNEGRDMGTVLWELFQSGFDAEWQIISAASVGAPHLRERTFIIAYPSSKRCHNCGSFDSKNAIQDNQKWDTAKNIRTWNEWQRWLKSVCSNRDWFGAPSGVSGVVDGVPNRVERIRGLGNAIVPQCGAVALRRVLELARANSQPG